MSREWKPGDVALRSYLGNSFTSMYVPACAVRDHDSGPHWHHADGGWDRRDGSSTYRPLVVIDHEDREQVERFVRSYFTEWEKSPDAHRIALPGETMPLQSHADAAQAALRSLIALPKPEEPQGLGAVVEDEGGVPWVRCENADREPHWYARNKMRAYADITAVRVLSEGVVA